MEKLSFNVSGCRIPKGQIAVFWLGQAGFIFKTPDGTLIAVDPYLSNCCYRYFGFKRLMPTMLEPNDIVFDAVIASHAHYDHFDVDAMPTLLSNGHTHLFTALDGREECDRLHLNQSQITYLKCDDIIDFMDFRIQAVPCDHGKLALYALGLLLTFRNKTIYFTGDTAFRPDLFKNPLLHNTDLLILPINGMFGNMNESEAAAAALKLSPKMTVPCHFWNFAEHGGNPGEFAKKMKEATPNIPYTLMQMGGMILI